MSLCTVFCACPLSIHTYKENYCRLWRLCMKGRTCLCGYRQCLGTVFVLKIFHSLQTIRSGKSTRVLVISPMASLIVDHVQNLWNISVKAFIMSSITGIVAVAKELQEPVWVSSLLFWAPESLRKSKWRKVLKNLLNLCSSLIASIDIEWHWQVILILFVICLET